MSQPAGSIDGTLRVTEQGEMLQALSGLPDIALRTMEVYTSGTLEAWLTPAPPPSPEWRAAWIACATLPRRLSRHRLRASALRRVLPRGHARSGAERDEHRQPAARRQTPDAEAGVKSLRAIPWQFAWTQTRLLLGAWLGADDALEQALARGERDQLRQMYRRWPYFRSVIELIEMVLAKSDAPDRGRYDRRLVPADLQPLGAQLRARLGRRIGGVLEVTGQPRVARVQRGAAPVD